MNKTRIILLLMALMPIMAHAQADKKLINKAQQGDTKSMITLGTCYENGAGVEVDSALAKKWFNRAAEAGDLNGKLAMSRYYLLDHDTARYYATRKECADAGFPNGIAALYTCYAQGRGVAKDTAKANELLNKAVSMGSEWGYVIKGYELAFGPSSTPKERKQGVSYLEKAYKLNQYEAAAYLASYYMTQEDYKNALKWAKEGMKWGFEEAYQVFAFQHFVGQGMKMDEPKAIALATETIAKHHNAPRMRGLLGMIYLTADDMTLRDTAKAISIWEQGTQCNNDTRCLCLNNLAKYYYNKGEYERAYDYALAASHTPTKSGSADAYIMLVQLALNREDAEIDTLQIMEWLQCGVDDYQNNDCAFALARLYAESGNKPLAAKYYRLANQYGSTASLQELGKLYEESSNHDLAIECYNQMIEQGNMEGYFHKGMALANQNDKKGSLATFIQGCKKGDPLSTCMMGKIYQNGLSGYKVDLNKAAKYYRQSEVPEANYQLGALLLNGQIGKQKPAELEEGLNYLKLAAQSQHTGAILDLGVIYSQGIIFDSINHEFAVECFQQLVDLDVPEGHLWMGLYYSHYTVAENIPLDSVKAVEYITYASDQGIHSATDILGCFYRDGEFVPQDCDKAFSLFNQAYAEGGSAIALYHMGQSYLTGCGVDIDTAYAIPLLKTAGNYGQGSAAYQIAEMYNYGRGGLPQIADSAIHYYILGHQGGCADASNIIGQQLIREEAYEAAIPYLIAASKGGNSEAMTTYALCLQNGIGIKEADPKAAVDVLEKAITYQDARAYTKLGLAYLQGNGCPEDEPLAHAYFDTAANMGNIEGMYYLAICKLNGYGCRVDTAAAISWLERAADNESIDAINTLGDVYEDMEDFKNAVLYYEKGLAMGSLNSYCNLAYCYERGQGVVLNSQKAYELYLYAAEHGSARGMRAVAGCYINGIYVAESYPEALTWMKKAAEQGDVVAMYYCGALLESGEGGVVANPKEAAKWYAMAAAQGHEAAQVALSRMTIRK